MLRTIFIILCTLSLTTVFSGCASKQANDENEEALFQSSQDLIANEKYHLAVLRQELFEQRYPFSHYAEKNQIDLMFSRYKNGQQTEAVILADRFIRLHPDHKQVAYAWYVKALATYDLSRSNRSFLTGKDISLRDSKQARQAFDYFRIYLENFPQHKYAPDARLKQLDIRNRLATYDVKVAQFYFERKAWVAAVNRANKVLEDYAGSPLVEDALRIMADSYLQMGEAELANQIQQQLTLLQ